VVLRQVRLAQRCWSSLMLWILVSTVRALMLPRMLMLTTVLAVACPPARSEAFNKTTDLSECLDRS
jgi:hypothetical protein